MALDLYLIRSRGNRYILFGPSDLVERCEIESGDRVRRFIQWMVVRPNRIAAALGRVLRSAHEYYIKLEDRIDPVERVLKAIAGSSELVVHFGPSLKEEDARSRFRHLLRRQRMKHTFWLVLDALFAPITLVLAPVPGPNVIGYYPLLRFLSHYRAARGTTLALGSMPVQFKSLPDLSTLEENLQTPRFDRAAVRGFTARLQIRGLDQFLERMV